MMLRLAAALALATSAVAPVAAQTAPAPVPAAASAVAPKPNLSVHAPNAQALLAKMVAGRPELFLLGLHATIPGTPDNAIIASTDSARIGKPSSAGDMALIGKTKIVVARLPAKHVFEVAMPIADAQGRPVGMLVDQMKIDAITDEVDALKRALALRSELERGIRDEAWLFAG